MRISDWSSDVCSSDLLPWNPGARNGARMDDAPDNLLAALPRAAAGEVFTELLARPGVRLERIVSAGQTTPADAPMVQDRSEERRVGNECVRTCRSRWAPDHYKKK